MKLQFDAIVMQINHISIVKIPSEISHELPSRGMVMIHGLLKDSSFIVPLEPDGKGSHWFELSDYLLNHHKLSVGDSVNFVIEPMDIWIEPVIPSDILDTIISEGLLKEWQTVTTKAKWDWLRWIQFTKNPDTRKKRIQIACSKLRKGDKRPCCFDRSRCTVTEVSKTGILLD